jgi:hypothetical protein
METSKMAPLFPPAHQHAARANPGTSGNQAREQRWENGGNEPQMDWLERIQGISICIPPKHGSLPS